jgi:leader peptidase (prepilin peptidase)/N-methyltransferase
MIDADWLHAPAALIPLVAILGLLVGSFLNVVILRLPRRLEHEWKQQAREILTPDTGDEQVVDDAPPDLVFTGSHCLHCKHKLSPSTTFPS